MACVKDAVKGTNEKKEGMKKRSKDATVELEILYYRDEDLASARPACTYSFPGPPSVRTVKMCHQGSYFHIQPAKPLAADVHGSLSIVSRSDYGPSNGKGGSSTLRSAFITVWS